jgi:anaphase-promoting complex subunit 3
MENVIRDQLSNGMFESARFLAERIYAHDSNDVTCELLAECHLKSNSPQRALSVLETRWGRSRGNAPSRSRYLMARCYFSLDKSQDAEDVLLQGTGIGTGENLEGDLKSYSENVPGGAYGLHLLGLISRKTNRSEQAILYLSQSLQLNPYLWSSFEILCELGHSASPELHFDVNRAERVANSMKASRGNTVTTSTTTLNIRPSTLKKQISETKSNSTRLFETPVGMENVSFVATPANMSTSSMHTPQFFETPQTNTPIMPPPPQVEDLKRKKKKKTRSSTLGESSHITPVNGGRLFSTAGQKASAPPRTEKKIKRSRLKTPSTTGLITPRVHQTRSQTARLSSASSSSSSLSSTFKVPETKQVTTTTFQTTATTLTPKDMIELLRYMGKAYQLLCMYYCTEASKCLKSLPLKHRHTGWVQHQLGRAAFERADYNEAREHFMLMRKLEPHRMQGLELFSTSLWQLKKDVELCFLSQEVVAFDRKSPEVWCVIGNCFSLQKEHTAAMKFFQRAIQLDPDFSYAYTLCGHEYISNEDFDKAVTFFRNAIRTHDRHYTAWFGVGTIYYRQEKYQLAEYHFRRALKINPRSSVLYCYLGMVLHAKKQLKEALHVLDSASKLDPMNPQPKYQRAKVLQSMGRLEAALEELKAVRDRAPREASVHMLMGQLYERLKDKDNAMIHYTTALDLKPQEGGNIVKSAIDRLHSDLTGDSGQSKDGDGGDGGMILYS